MDVNRVVLMGRLTKDPDVRYSQGDQPVAIARYTLAVDRRQKKKEGQPSADFISCVAFGRAGEFAEKYLHKGMRICISGRIQTGSYTRQDGTKAYTTDVIVDDQEFAEGKADSGRNAMDDQTAAQYGARQQDSQRSHSGDDAGTAAGRTADTEGTGSGEWQQDAVGGFVYVQDGEELPFN